MILTVFIISLVYWCYLYFHSSMIIVFDAVGYEQLGHLLHDQGWIAYFKTGPNREPLYPLSIAASMWLADIFHVSYQKVQVAFQLLLLALSQILLWRLLLRFNINKMIIAGILLYWAISPAIVNSALSLFSEIMAYPLILLFIGFSLDILGPMAKGGNGSYLLRGIMWGLTAFALVMVKAISIYILLVVGCWLVGVLVWRWVRGTQRQWVVVGAICMGMLILQSGTIYYQTLNKKYNNCYAITDRGPLMFYGNVARRLQPHDSTRIKAAIALVPGEGVCRLVASATDCQYWQFMTSDSLGTQRLNVLGVAENHDPDNINRAFMHETKGLVLTHPLPVAFFGVLEGLKMFFWESTQVGFVTYPSWLTHVYAHTIFKSLLRLLMAVITLIACVSVANMSLKSRNVNAFLLVFVVMMFIGAYSWVTVLTRYAFPIVPIYMLIVAYWLNQVCYKRSG